MKQPLKSMMCWDATKKQQNMTKWLFDRASDQEGLRLIVAFLQIREPQLRQQIIMEVETLALSQGVEIQAMSSHLLQDNDPRTGNSF